MERIWDQERVFAIMSSTKDTTPFTNDDSFTIEHLEMAVASGWKVHENAYDREDFPFKRIMALANEENVEDILWSRRADDVSHAKLIGMRDEDDDSEWPVTPFLSWDYIQKHWEQFGIDEITDYANCDGEFGLIQDMDDFDEYDGHNDTVDFVHVERYGYHRYFSNSNNIDWEYVLKNLEEDWDFHALAQKVPLEHLDAIYGMGSSDDILGFMNNPHVTWEFLEARGGPLWDCRKYFYGNPNVHPGLVEDLISLHKGDKDANKHIYLEMLRISKMDWTDFFLGKKHEGLIDFPCVNSRFISFKDPFGKIVKSSHVYLDTIKARIANVEYCRRCYKRAVSTFDLPEELELIIMSFLLS